MSVNGFSLRFSWGQRPESPAQLGERLLRSVEALRQIHPLFESWWFTDLVALEHVPIDEVRPRIAALVEQGVQRDDDDEPEPAGGYTFLIVNDKKGTPQKVELRTHGGGNYPKLYFGNGGVFSTEYGQIPDPAIVAYPVFEAVMMAMVRVWDATSASAICSDLHDARDKAGRFFGPAWMTYLAAPLASRITRPSGALCEATPDGGLLMIAAEETFDVNDPSHMAGAWAISDALVSLTRKELWY